MDAVLYPPALHRLPLPNPGRGRRRKLGIITADIGVAPSLSMTHKAIGFDRRLPEIAFDTLDLPATNTLPVGIEGGARHDGARNRQQPRRSLGED